MNVNGILRMGIILAIAILGGVYATAAEAGNEFDISATSGLSSVAEKVQWHGYYEFEYWDDESKNTTFDAHKITVWMGLPINDKVWLSSEIEYEHFPRLKDAGTQRNGGSGEIKVDSAQLRFTPVDGFVTYMGIFYIPFGMEYLSYPGQKNKLVTRPKVMKSGGIIPGTWSDVGIGFSKAFGGIGHLDAYYINGDAKNGGISRDSSTGGNESKSLGLRLMLDDMVEGFNIGASWVSGKWDTADDNDSSRWGMHLRIDSDKIFGKEKYPVFLGEYIGGKDENASSVAGEDKKVSGFYVQLSSRLHPLAELVARYGVYDSDEEKADNQKTETSLGFVLHAMDNFQFKGEYQWNGEEGTKTGNNVVVLQVVAFW